MFGRFLFGMGLVGIGLALEHLYSSKDDKKDDYAGSFQDWKDNHVLINGNTNIEAKSSRENLKLRLDEMVKLKNIEDYRLSDDLDNGELIIKYNDGQIIINSVTYNS